MRYLISMCLAVFSQASIIIQFEDRSLEIKDPEVQKKIENAIINDCLSCHKEGSVSLKEITTMEEHKPFLVDLIKK